MKKVRVAINGFGRIGRGFFKLAWENKHIEVVAVNDLGDVETLAYLLRYDSIYGTFSPSVETSREDRQALVVDGKNIMVLSFQ